MPIQINPSKFESVDSEALVFPVFEDQLLDSEELKRLDGITGGIVKELIDGGELKGKLAESVLVHRPAGLSAKRLLLVGAGKKADWDPANLRKVAGTSWRVLNKRGVKTAAFQLLAAGGSGLSVQIAAEGFTGAAFESDTYKTEERQEPKLQTMVILIPSDIQNSEAEEMVRRGVLIGEALNFTRALVNEPANRLPPRELASRAVKMAQTYGLKHTVIEQEEMQTRGMGGILAVSQGSEEPPKLIVLEYEPTEVVGTQDLVALVGKGVCFDTGGISLKPAEGMEEMKADMAGGAAVIGAMRAIAQLRPAVRVIGVVPAVENMPSGKSFRPGDVIKAMNGKSIEVANTDAEGRLILADSLSYVVERGAKVIIDIATLTGACKVALGTVYAGLFASEDSLALRLQQQRRITGEKLWRLPLDSDYKKFIQSDIADVRNIGNRWGGAIYAALFLQNFVAQVPWAHLDIAGVDWFSDPPSHHAKGPTGFGFRTLLEFVLQRS